ncbi:MAPEG family protein [Methylophaga sp.]|uniref:MAPEG family protein n=1 Tax=Methylophaga sp. TaxID=2024840 RepID=UPI003F6A131A
MITALYASLSALLLVKLSLRVISLRRKHRISLGDGGNADLQAAIRTQGNATEYIPIILILMMLLEWATAAWWIIHLAGIAMLVGRLFHASAIRTNNFKHRALGMKITFFLIFTLAALNIFYLIAGYFFTST